MTGTAVQASDTFLDLLQRQLNERIDQRKAVKAEIDQLLAGPTAEKRALTDQEETKFGELRSQISVFDCTDPTEARYAESIHSLQERVKELSDMEQRQYETSQTSTPSAAGHISVRKEERTYGPAAEKRGVSFLRDVMNAQTRSDFRAAERLERHMQEERVERAEYIEGIEQRDVTTGAFAGLTVPQYLTDMVAPAVKNKRPFLDICRKHPLPAQGMTVEISRITTETTVAVQATQGAAVSETDIDDTLLTVNIRTYSGQQDLARQVIDRTAGGDDIVIQDLIGSYHSALDSGCINDDGTSGTHLGVRNVSGNAGVTYTDASPTIAEFHPKLANLISDMSAGPNGLSHFIFNPRRWWWMASQLSSTFPLMGFMNAPNQGIGQAGGTGYEAGGRTLFGPPAILDRNIPTNLGAGTNEDVVIGVDAEECHLWEDPNAPLLIRAEQSAAGNLMVKFVVYGYSAFTAGRYPLATGDISGTGLVTPSF